MAHDDLGPLAQVAGTAPSASSTPTFRSSALSARASYFISASAFSATSNLIFDLLGPAARGGRVLDQAAQVDQRQRPALIAEPLDQVEAAAQAAELPRGAAAGLEVAVLLARDDQRPGRGRPVGEQLPAPTSLRAAEGFGVEGTVVVPVPVPWDVSVLDVQPTSAIRAATKARTASGRCEVRDIVFLSRGSRGPGPPARAGRNGRVPPIHPSARAGRRF